MSTTLAQPFVSDADGVFNFFADGLYKIVITDAAGITLYTLDNWQFIDRTDPTFGEGTVISSASTIAVGPEIFVHIGGSTNIDTITGTIPFVWAVFDGNLTLNYSANLLTPASINLAVRTGDVVFFLNDGAGVWRVSNHYQSDGLLISTQDTRTTTVDIPLTIRSTTSAAAAAGIGTGLLVQAESADESPSDLGQIDFSFSDVTAGSEDSFFRILLRLAGAAITSAYKFMTTSAFQAIFTHANTADRTYTLPNRTVTLESANVYMGPTSVGTGSNHSHEGTVTISASQALSGIHYYTDFTLNVGQTLTLADDSGHLTIVATGLITINGTIDGIGAGSAGGTGRLAAVYAHGSGVVGLAQPGGGGGGGVAGGDGFTGGGVVGISAGGIGGLTVGPTGGTAGVQVTTPPFGVYGCLGGGGSGGAGGGTATAGANGGRAGASINLIAPAVTLGAASTLNTSGAAGATAGGGNAAGGGGGGAGNIFIACQVFTNNGCVFTMTGGAAGNGNGGGAAGAAGAAGVRQTNIYP